jgi:DNA-binding protein H-NS
MTDDALRHHRSAEQIATLRTIRKLMDFWRISPAELRGPLPPAKPRATVLAPAARYCHPVSGLVWNGEGPQPDWLKAALLREGYTVDELRQPPRPAG